MIAIPTEEKLIQACAAIPLFPLPHVVLFPNTILRLHVFEPRYVALLEDCMDGDKLMSIPQLKAQQMRGGVPAIHSISGLGMVVHCEALEDNRYNIIVLGLRRLNIQEELSSDKPYRIAKAEVLAENWQAESFDISSIQRLLTQVVVQNPQLSGSIEVLLKEELSSYKVLNILAHILFREAKKRQIFLEQSLLQERASLIEEVLADLLMRGNNIME